jgi:hypothetical protein
MSDALPEAKMIWKSWPLTRDRLSALSITRMIFTIKWRASNAWYPRLTATMILSGSFVHRKGLGLALAPARKRLMVV